MFQIMAFIFTLFGAYTLYLTSRHQQWQIRPLKKSYRWLSYGLFALALYCFSLSLSFTPALFMWLFSSSTVLTLMPLMAALKVNRSQS
ncbi:hypothetical protein [Shewanella waksmanii]|uniref:hypothetical protein n=1 Tax=Shewanella waksmanii TaxID=213783 RepID=UPI003736A467